MAIYGFLVCYYPEYKKNAIKQFSSLLNLIDDSNNLIVIDNSNSSAEIITPFDSLLGTNRAGEFSSWDEGVRYLESKYQISGDDIFLFANDTFCHHRVFTVFNKYLFKVGLNKLSKNIMLVGDVCNSPLELELYGFSGSQWVSTYLFGMNVSTYRKLGKLTYLEDRASISINMENKKVSCKECSEVFNNYISNWLFPCDENQGWYKSKDTTIDTKQFKTQAIMNEKLVSFRLDGKFADVYPNKLSRLSCRLIGFIVKRYRQIF